MWRAPVTTTTTPPSKRSASSPSATCAFAPTTLSSSKLFLRYFSGLCTLKNNMVVWGGGVAFWEKMKMYGKKWWRGKVKVMFVRGKFEARDYTTLLNVFYRNVYFIWRKKIESRTPLTDQERYHIYFQCPNICLFCIMIFQYWQNLYSSLCLTYYLFKHYKFYFISNICTGFECWTTTTWRPTTRATSIPCSSRGRCSVGLRPRSVSTSSHSFTWTGRLKPEKIQITEMGNRL